MSASRESHFCCLCLQCGGESQLSENTALLQDTNCSLTGERELLSSPTMLLCRKLPPPEASVRTTRKELGARGGGEGAGGDTDTTDFEATLISADQDRTIATGTNGSEGH